MPSQLGLRASEGGPRGWPIDSGNAPATGAVLGWIELASVEAGTEASIEAGSIEAILEGLPPGREERKTEPD